MEGLDVLERDISDFRENVAQKEWLLVRRNGLDMLRFGKKALDEYEAALDDVSTSRFKFDWEFHGTLGYALVTVPLAAFAPYVGVPLLIDSSVRTCRMAFRSEPPVGLVGTVRELCKRS